jgi:hypothetical protein
MLVYGRRVAWAQASVLTCPEGSGLPCRTACNQRTRQDQGRKAHLTHCLIYSLWTPQSDLEGADGTQSCLCTSTPQLACWFR